MSVKLESGRTAVVRCLCLVLAAASADGLCRTGRAESAPALLPQPDYQQNRLVGDSLHRRTGSAQYRLPDDAQYRLADNVRGRLSDNARFRPSSTNDRPGPPVSVHAARYRSLIDSTARAVGIEPELLHAVITVESGYDSLARSPKGALGLMQLMPATAVRYAVGNPHDPAQNLNAGARHLRYLLVEFNNDLGLALAAYNAGEGAVRKHGNCIPPYPETRAYVRRVLAFYLHRLLLRRSEPL